MSICNNWRASFALNIIFKGNDMAKKAFFFNSVVHRSDKRPEKRNFLSIDERNEKGRLVFDRSDFNRAVFRPVSIFFEGIFTF